MSSIVYARIMISSVMVFLHADVKAIYLHKDPECNDFFLYDITNDIS